MSRSIKKKKGEIMPGTLVHTQSGRYIAFYECRTDIIANGENEKDALKNLRELYKSVMEHEKEEGIEHEEEEFPLVLPAHYETKPFQDKAIAV